jgi:hypothetical protein
MTILYKQEIPHEFPAPHIDLLQQVIEYRVPPSSLRNGILSSLALLEIE